jgi:hypothetical protein
MKMHWIPLLICLAAGSLPLSAALEAAPPEKTPQSLKWPDLKASIPFENPFDKLSAEQLLDLGVIAQLRSMEAQNKGDQVSHKMQTEAGEATARLEAQAVDINGLLAKRTEIAERRNRSKNAAATELNGALISLSGFVLPLEYKERKVTEFLLVPWVGACIHTPPPPSNQIVHVKPAKPFTTKGLFEAVTVTGVIQTSEMNKDLYHIDGNAKISISYTMSHTDISKYATSQSRDEKE